MDGLIIPLKIKVNCTAFSGFYELKPDHKRNNSKGNKFVLTEKGGEIPEMTFEM